MWLPMGFSLSRNYTFDKVAAGGLRNIRMHTVSPCDADRDAKRLKEEAPTRAMI